MIEAVCALAGIGLLFNFLAVVGLLRFPDVYTRMHASTKCTTFGSLFIGFAVVAYAAMYWTSASPIYILHTMAVLAALLLTNPTGAHAIARGAYKSGVKPKGAVIDEYKGAAK